MDEIISTGLSVSVAIFGILLMIGGITRHPWGFASRPYVWLLQTMQTMVRNTLRRLFRLLSRVLQGIVDLALSGIIAFCRRFPMTTTILILITIAVIALAYAGFL